MSVAPQKVTLDLLEAAVTFLNLSIPQKFFLSGQKGWVTLEPLPVPLGSNVARRGHEDTPDQGAMHRTSPLAQALTCGVALASPTAGSKPSFCVSCLLSQVLPQAPPQPHINTLKSHLL